MPNLNPRALRFTVCAADGRVLGPPTSIEDALRALRRVPAADSVVDDAGRVMGRRLARGSRWLPMAMLPASRTPSIHWGTS